MTNDNNEFINAILKMHNRCLGVDGLTKMGYCSWKEDHLIQI
jgi:hypothetical protein